MAEEMTNEMEVMDELNSMEQSYEQTGTDLTDPMNPDAGIGIPANMSGFGTAVVAGLSALVSSILAYNGGKISGAKRTIKDLSELGLIDEKEALDELARLEKERKREKKFSVEFNWPVKINFGSKKKDEAKKKETVQNKVVDAEFTQKAEEAPKTEGKEPEAAAEPEKVS